ncbi:MAG: hypothetical protein GY941_16390 [Planctomycetes bacterium]|nr:hypothetical protein [Planctomycetota bacterium]
MNNKILTDSGLWVDLKNPSIDTILITDIARGLANTCRYTGQCSEFYSVAQHSVLVSKAVPPEKALKGLMHDAQEAYLGDISSPLKALLPEYRKLEDNFQSVIYKKYNLGSIKDANIKKADLAVMRLELDFCFSGVHDTKWEILDGAEEYYEEIEFWNPESAYWSFLERFEELYNQ